MPYFGEDHFLSQQSAKEIMVELVLFVSQWLLLASDQQCRRKYRINHDYSVPSLPSIQRNINVHHVSVLHSDFNYQKYIWRT